jgi:hypothetical protein
LVDAISQLPVSASSQDKAHAVDEIFEELVVEAMELGFHLSLRRLSRILRRCGRSKGEPHRNVVSREMVRNLSFTFRPWVKIDGATTFVKALDPKTVLPTWGVLYCGGAKQVLADLEKISDEYRIGLHVESFEW